MKITSEHYSVMEAAITPLMKEIPFEVYSSEGLTAKRWRWDLTYRAGLSVFICDELYSYMDDTHIDTALRRITNTK